MKDTKKTNRRKNIYLIIGLLAIVIIFILIYLFLLKKTDIETVKDSVVMIETYNEEGSMIGTGSGFCVYQDNYIATNFHVIEGARTIKIIDDDKKEYNIDEIKIIKEDEDLAILSGNFSFRPIKIDNSKLKAGDPVIAIGSPKGQLNTVSTGVVSNADDEYEVRITAPISPGSSGGVLLNGNNKVIGITYAGYNAVEAQNINYAISVKYLNEMYKYLNESKGFYLPKEQAESNLDNIFSGNKSNIYYFVDNLEIFYEATSKTKKLENALAKENTSWHKIYMNLSEQEKEECVSILEILNNKKNAEGKGTLIKLKDAIKDYTDEELAYEIAVEKYKYAIILENMLKINDTEKMIEFINKLPLKNGQKVLLKYSLIYKDIKSFNDEENNDLVNYLFKDVYNSPYNSDCAAAVLERMGYKVELKGNTYITTWD